MKKTYPLVLIPTEKADAGALVQNVNGSFWKQLTGNAYFTQEYLKSVPAKSFHLYAISDDEIKEGDWVISLFNNRLFQSNVLTTKGLEITKKFNDVERKEYKKIIATTDKSLNSEISTKEKRILDDANQPYPKNKPSNWILPQFPESFIQAYIKAYNDGNPITEVDLEWMNGGDNKHYNAPRTRLDNTVIVHQSKTYTRDEVEALLNKVHKNGSEWGLNHSYASSGLNYPTEESRIKKLDKWIQDNL